MLRRRGVREEGRGGGRDHTHVDPAHTLATRSLYPADLQQLFDPLDIIHPVGEDGGTCANLHIYLQLHIYRYCTHSTYLRIYG